MSQSTAGIAAKSSVGKLLLWLRERGLADGVPFRGAAIRADSPSPVSWPTISSQAVAAGVLTRTRPGEFAVSEEGRRTLLRFDRLARQPPPKPVEVIPIPARTEDPAVTAYLATLTEEQAEDVRILLRPAPTPDMHPRERFDATERYRLSAYERYVVAGRRSGHLLKSLKGRGH